MAAQQLGALEQVLLGGLEEAAVARLQLGARLEVAHERVPRVVELRRERSRRRTSSAIFSSTIAS